MDKPSQKILVLLDGNALIHRAYHALPPLTAKGGETVHAVYGFAMTLLSVLEKFHPEYIAASFDLAGPTFRHEAYEEYKATRVKAPDDLYAQIPRVKELVRAFNIPIYELEGYEADDCVGTIARQAILADPALGVVIVTGDNDALQLVNDRTKIFTLRKGIKDTVLYDEAAVRAKYGLSPAQLRDFKGLRGDTSDNIPGVKGIGEKGAVALLQKYGTLEGVYAALHEITGATHDKLERDREQAFLSKKLGTIDTDAPVELRLADAVAREYDRDAVAKLFQEFGFRSLVKRLPGGSENVQPTTDNPQRKPNAKSKPKTPTLKTVAEAEQFLNELEGEVAVTLDVQAGTLFGSGLQGLDMYGHPKKTARIPFTAETKALLKNFFENKTIRKIFYDAKKTMKILATEGVEVRGIAWDVMLSGYLLHSGSDVSLEHMASEELGEEEKRGEAETVLKLKEMHEQKLHAISQEQGGEKTLETVLHDIEMPLVPILFRMEQAGIRLNGQVLKKLSDEMTKTIKEIEGKIYMFAGREFNVNSPKQLAQILFEDLKIPTQGIKKTKTGISTASSELEKLKGEYPIAALIEEYREQSKLKNTYLDVLPRLVDTNSRVHTTYEQAVAATGRLSSVDPNLQNIPSRGEWSERIRSAFEAEAGHVLVGADYSQIELRVAAHLSDDAAMTDAFQRGIDIHTATAAAVYRVERDAVTPDMRRQAKVFNFGILYGMGAYGLSQAAGIDQKQAAEFIEAYFKQFSGIAEYVARMKQEAKNHGYVETELGRRRYVPEINSSNQQIARASERMAVNMPVQGLAADIMKLAMLAADRLVAEKYSNTVKMLLQIHDELIFEARETAVERFMADVKQVMESVYTLKVPLIVEVFSGKNWGEI